MPGSSPGLPALRTGTVSKKRERVDHAKFNHVADVAPVHRDGQ